MMPHVMKKSFVLFSAMFGMGLVIAAVTPLKAAANGPKVFDPANILPRLDGFLAARSFEESLLCGDTASAVEEKCTTQCTDGKCQEVCTQTELVSNVTDCSAEQVTVESGPKDGKLKKVKIKKSEFEANQGNTLRFMIAKAPVLNEKDYIRLDEVLPGAMALGASRVDSMTVRISFVNYDERSGTYITAPLEFKLGKGVPYVAQVLEIKTPGVKGGYKLSTYTRGTPAPASDGGQGGGTPPPIGQ